MHKQISIPSQTFHFEGTTDELAELEEFLTFMQQADDLFQWEESDLGEDGLEEFTTPHEPATLARVDTPRGGEAGDFGDTTEEDYLAYQVGDIEFTDERR